MKVAIDFVSPENLGECLKLTEEFRLLPLGHRAKEDKLGVGAMLSCKLSAGQVRGRLMHGLFFNVQVMKMVVHSAERALKQLITRREGKG